MNNDRLKFRVWDKTTKRYFYLELKFGDNGYHPEFIQDPVFEQCTGLRDENDNLIYEGDIIKCEIDIERELSVVWDDGCFGVYVPTHDDFVKFYTLGNFTKHEWEVKNIEIIGNIHEQKD